MKVPPAQQRLPFATPIKSDAKSDAPNRRNLVIEAGAGTGKTTAIVAEVLARLLENEDLAPERIVLVTFTEKAAGEIADRIHEALTELESRFDSERADERVSWPIGSSQPLLVVPPDKRAAYQRAGRAHLARIDSLRSQTIHSFCQSLLRQFPIEAGLDPQFKIIEGFERSLLYGRIYDDWLDSETRLRPEPQHLAEWETLLGHTGYLFMVRELIFSLIERRDLLSEEGHDFGGIEEVDSGMIPHLRRVRQIDRRLIDELDDEAAKRLLRYVKDTEPIEPGATLDQWIDYLAPIAEAIRNASLPRKNKHEHLKFALMALRAGDAKGDSIYDRLTSHRAAVALVALTRRFLQRLDDGKREIGVVDFDDLLLRTIALLDNETALDRIRQQYDYLFVDEFQDTDRMQARIIDRLARDRSGAFVAGKSVLVGDPKQSIYGFRRADPETYYQTTAAVIAGGAEHRIIIDQYRSDPPLLRSVNAMFACLFPPIEHDPNVFRPTYHALRAAKERGHRASGAPIVFLGVEQGEKANRHFHEAEAIAEWIREHRHGGDGGDGDLQRFAILFRRLTRVEDYLDTLDRYGIDYVLPPTRLFLDRRAPVDLVTVLRAIAYPFDRGAEISAARSPYFALTDNEIASWSGFSPAAEPREKEAYTAFHDAITRYRAAARHASVSELIDLVIDTSGIEKVYDAAADSDRSKRHLEHVRAIAFAYDQKIGGSVRQFVDEIARRRGEPDEAEPSLVDESRNAVRILSVHAAKGLEFETVILPDLDFHTPGSEGAELFLVDDPKSIVMRGRAESLTANFRVTVNGDKLKKIASMREEAEMRRLFYVAVTRAKSEVVFICNSGEFRKRGFFACLSEIFGFDKESFGSLWPPEPGKIMKTLRAGEEEVAVAFERMGRGTLGERTQRRLADQSLQQELAGGALADPAIAQPVPVAERLTPADAAVQRAGSRNRAAGILLHRVLERWDGDPSLLESLCATLATEAGADSTALSRVRQRFGVVSRSETLQRILAAETIGRELPIRTLDDAGQVAEARLDRLIRENGRLIVIDYKSGTPSEPRLANDKKQVAQYCRLVEQLAGEPSEGLLWYIDLENDRVVAVNQKAESRKQK
ncbi:MAG TPA: UvrD-helicase domain-containing protein, partial [Thermoanaerobaculia bacterium]|nr:UvrD-helicase domain-containing protein [Thermoanaerobaculia bacterium]